MKIYIPDIDYSKYNKSDLFPAIRPFLKENKIGNFPEQLERWGIQNQIISVVNKCECDFILYPLILLSSGAERRKFKDFSEFANKNNHHKIIIYISGDFGFVYPKISNVIYYRMGGFNSQLDRNNRIFPFLLSNHLKGILNLDSIIVSDKKLKPVIGFCGHASANLLKFMYENIKYMNLNIRRVLYFNFNFETYFPSAYNRKKILENIEKTDLTAQNFILREKYRGGFVDEITKAKSIREYYHNMMESDYVLCVRGAGNFSVRFYETLHMGRIPVLIDTDCKLPFEDLINWDNHIIRIPWKKRYELNEIVSSFHNSLSNEQFENLQISNRTLWQNLLNLNGFFVELKSLC